jgi:hypothetical protein
LTNCVHTNKLGWLATTTGQSEKRRQVAGELMDGTLLVPPVRLVILPAQKAMSGVRTRCRIAAGQRAQC